MSFRNPPIEVIQDVLRKARTIAVVGLSDDPARPSCEVSQSMRTYGYRIIPVNPSLQAWEGVPAHPTLEAAAASLGAGETIDIVNVFRRPAQVGAVVEDCLRLGLQTLWLQLGVVNEVAAERAQQAGMTVVMDRCIFVDRSRLPD